MAPAGSFLLSRAEVLGVYGDTFYNRVTLVNNVTPLTKSRCWVHQTASDIRDFEADDSVECSCGFYRRGFATCAQRQYVEQCLQRVWERRSPEERSGLVCFGNTRCVALLLNDGVYLFSSFQRCEQRNGFAESHAAKVPLAHTPTIRETSIVCSDCREAAAGTLPKFMDVVAALKGLLRGGDALGEGLTLMEKFPIDPSGSNTNANVYQALDRAQGVARAVGALEGLVATDEQYGSFELGVDTGLMASCNDLAESLIASCRAELVAVCSSLIGNVNAYCQPPLKVRLRWLRHYMALEYRVEFSADLTNCFFDAISGRYVPDLARENVVLHEIVQCSQVSLVNVEECFRLALGRMRDYLAVRDLFYAKTESESVTPVGNGAVSYVTGDVAPFWWNYYSFSNTLGEGEVAAENYAVKRLTRSQFLKAHEDGASTPIARKSRNSLEEHLVTTHCVSSDNLANSRGTTFEAPTGNRKLLRELNSSESSNHSLNCKTTPSLSNRSLKNPSNDEVDDPSSLREFNVCFCFKCLESVSTFGRHFGAREFRQEDHLYSAVFGDAGFANGLGEIYNGCHVEDWDEYKTASALRRSIRAAVEASSSLGRVIVNDHRSAKNLVGHSIKILNTALLSTLRLGDFIYSTRNAMEVRLGEQSDSVKEFYDSGEPMEDEASDDSCSSESTLRDIISNSFVVGTNTFTGLYSTFENDQYIQQDLVETEDVPNLSPKPVVHRSPRRKAASPTQRRSLSNMPNSSIESASEVSGRQSRKCARDPTSNNEVYIYDLSERNDALSESAVEDWYDSDGSVRGSRRQRQKPSTSSLTEIYGNHDALIPMGPLPIGVYFDASRKLWRCQWRENGKFRTKGFSLGHYSSLCEARRACILFRCQVGNMPVQPEWLNPNYVQVSQLLSKRTTATSTSTSTPKKSKRKRKTHAGSVEAPVVLDAQHVVLLVRVLEDPTRNPRLDLALNRALYRPRAVRRVVAQLRNVQQRLVVDGELDVLLRKPVSQLAELNADDALELVLGERVKDDELVQPVEELRREGLPHRLHHLVLHLGLLVRALGQLQDALAAEVGGEDDEAVGEVHRAPLGVGQPAVVEQLEHDVEDVGVRLLDLVKEQDRVGPPAHRLGQHPALVEADVARRRAQEPRDGVLLHVLGHVKAHNRVVGVEELLRDGLAQLGLADPRRPEEHEAGNRPLGVVHADPRALHRPRHHLHRLVLAHHALAQLTRQLQDLVALRPHQPAHGDPGPARDDAGDVLARHLVPQQQLAARRQHRLGVRLVGPHGLLQLLVQVRQRLEAELRRAVEVELALGLFNLDLDDVLPLLDVADGVHQPLLLQPRVGQRLLFHRQPLGRLLDLLQPPLLLRRLRPRGLREDAHGVALRLPARRIVRDGDALHLELQQLPLDGVELDGLARQLDLEPRRGLVDQVDGFVRQEPVPAPSDQPQHT
ncbi:63 kDa protein [Babesia caballi]|uniref:63 kDa protein n=1 Tax=Babesia caballi TaxID=5871 RepID=A0AAV4LW95_BABCB|nr:63 kDa protein [Babesia caballi]